MDSTSSATRPTVLIIDDTPANVGVLADNLVEHGFTVIVAQEGQEGIARARLAQPDIVLLDILMPGMDGFETCRRLKAEAATKDIPVIFMTALSDTTDKVTGFEIGGVDYVTKPFQADEVRARIDTHLALQAMRRQLAVQNQQLQQEIAVREAAEAALERARDELEERVVQRTAELSESRARLAAILDSALDAIITIDAEQRIIMFNPAAERMFGRSAGEVIGGRLERLIPERFRTIHAEHVRRFAESGVSQHIMGQGLLREVFGVRANGEEFPVDASISRSESAGQKLFTVMLRDITERKRADAERQARLAAEAADRAKTDLLANMSHELRSPLNTILGFTRLLSLEPVLSESMREDLGLILKSGEHLHALINDVLDMTKLEAGRMVVNETEFDLDFLLDEIKDMLTPSAVDKGLQLIFPARPGVPAYVRADALKLRQVLINIVGNSIKFTQRGEIVVRVAADPPDPGAPATRLGFTVSDTGAGIAPEELPQLFNAFAQAKAGRESHEGTGLGLAISRRFVELMGGQMQLESQLGAGTTVRFEIPVQVAEPPVYPGDIPGRRRVVGLAPGQPRYRLLAVDDHPEARQLLVRLLTPLGFELKEAGNGQEAINLWREWHPDLIWMDMRMPVLDGRDAARRIRSVEKSRRPVIIALTASAFEEERTDVLAAGCDDLVRKPFRPAELFAVLEKHLDVTFVYEEEPPALPAQLSAEALATLSGPLRRRLEKALVRLDTHGVDRVIAFIRGRNPQLAESLAEAAGNFQYDRILALLHASPAEKPQESKG